MRCPHCAGEILEDSRFCGICGQPVAEALGTLDVPPARFVQASPHPRRSAGAMVAAGTMSLFELPISRGARIARVALILVVDLALLGTGIAMIASYLADRERATRTAPAEVEEQAPAPTALDPSAGASAGRASAADHTASAGGASTGAPTKTLAETDTSASATAESRGRVEAAGSRGTAGRDGSEETGTAETAADAGEPKDPAARPRPDGEASTDSDAAGDAATNTGGSDTTPSREPPAAGEVERAGGEDDGEAGADARPRGAALRDPDDGEEAAAREEPSDATRPSPAEAPVQ